MSSHKLRSLKKRLSEIDKELKVLRQFRPTKALDQFKRRLEGERSYVRQQLKEQTQKPRKPTARERKRKLTEANKQRSEKVKRSWRYYKAIQENYHPEKSLREIRSAFKKRKEGLETDIKDVTWRNPSP